MDLSFLDKHVPLLRRLRGREQHDMRLMFLLSLILIVVSSALYSAMGPTQSNPFAFTGSGLCVAVNVALCGACMAGVRISKRWIYAWMAVHFVLILMLDVYQRAKTRQALWPLFVLVLDLSLLLRLGQGVALLQFGGVLVWLVATSAESWLRFGLYDMPGTSTRAYRLEGLYAKCVCGKPPCAEEFGVVAQELTYSVIVLIIDFAATRGFARQAEAEQASMARTIQAVETIADLLSQYDVDTVAEMLQEAKGQLPEAMHDALQRLEQNLRLYRPYLPAALFEKLVQEEPASLAAPGIVSGTAAIVFTDIRSSTSIWEAAPDAMKLAMQVHNTVLRKAIRAHDGYEVKTIGDAFMVAFEDAVAAISFGMAVHSDLLHAEWPASLMDVSLCRPVEGLWGGLTVRIGVNHGPVTVETNALTGRVDYLGHTVNVAARLEGACLPGAVALLTPLLAQVRPTLPTITCSLEKRVCLRGVKHSLTMQEVWPEALSRREHVRLSTELSFTLQSMGSSAGRGGATLTVVAKTRGLQCTLGSLLFLEGLQPLCDMEALLPRGLEAVLPLLQQSGGTVVTLFGSCVLCGWNLSKSQAAHAESAVRFAQRLQICRESTAMGIVTGPAHYGDIGTPAQLFVTLVGTAVETSGCLCRLAWQAGYQTLYMTPGMSPLPALSESLVPSKLAVPPWQGVVYVVQEEAMLE